MKATMMMIIIDDCYGCHGCHAFLLARFIDWFIEFYPWPQNHEAFKRFAPLIRTHIAGNGAALLSGAVLMCPRGWPPSPAKLILAVRGTYVERNGAHCAS